MNDQLILKFPTNKIYLKEDFYVSPSNVEAFNFIESWPRWTKRALNIFGPSGSGKSHLVSIFEKKTSTIKVNGDEINDEIFSAFKPKEALIIENFNESISENILYSIFNFSSQDNKFILITSNKALNLYKFNLPDLKSRINSSMMAEIKLPSDDLIHVILQKSFSDRQILVEKKHIDYIIKRIDRSYDKISKFTSILDTYSLKTGKSFSFKIIKEALKMLKN